jgi:hypothetical protein
MKLTNEYDIKLREGTRSDDMTIYLDGKMVVMKLRSQNS